MKTKKRKIGDLGENIAAKFIEKRGFTIIERNYQKPWGEIDIIAQKGNILHFIEVKTIQVVDVIHETNHYRPEDNMHEKKRKSLGSTIMGYLSEQKAYKEWQCDLITICLDSAHKRIKVGFLENIVL